MDAGRIYRVDRLTLDALNFILAQLSDRLDQIEGRRGTPTFYASPDLQGNRVTNIQAAVAQSDAIILAQAGGMFAPIGHNHTAAGESPVPEAGLVISDNTTGDVSAARHGFAPKAPGDITKFLRGDATWDEVPIPTQEAFPIGSIYLNVTGVDPATELGYGTWTQVAKGLALVGET